MRERGLKKRLIQVGEKKGRGNEKERKSQLDDKESERQGRLQGRIDGNILREKV